MQGMVSSHTNIIQLILIFITTSNEHLKYNQTKCNKLFHKKI